MMMTMIMMIYDNGDDADDEMLSWILNDEFQIEKL